MVKVSIIIPIYNAEKYLRQCLESVIHQTLQEIEIICINDGSTDSSLQILEEYALQDERIRIINKQNEGLVAARKDGVNAAVGTYIGYVDSDDWIAPEMYEELYALAVNNNVDLVTSGYFLEGNYTTIHLDTVEEGIYKEQEVSDLLNQTIYRLDKKETGLRGALWCKLFRKSRLVEAQNAVSSQLTVAEDKMCLLAYMLDCDSVYVLKKAYYHYRINNQSMVHKPNPNYLLAVNEVYQSLMEFYEHPRFTSQMRKQAEIYMVELLVMGINSRLGFENRNMMWIDPSWVDTIPGGSKVVLYGAGELGKKYKKHLAVREDIVYVGCVDVNYKNCNNGEFPVLPVEALSDLDYDYVVITIKNPKKAQEVKENLKKLVPEEKILWFEQPEIFWKYAQADGLL